MHLYEDLNNSLENFFEIYFDNNKILDFNHKLLADKRFYKYGSFDDEFLLENILNGQLYLQNIPKFNDPFDANPVFDFEKANKIILKYKHFSPAKTSEEYVRRRKIITEIFAGLRKSLFATCLTDHYDDILMWTHYAKNSSGICIEYKLDNCLDNLKTTVVPIRYIKDRPDFPVMLLEKLYRNELDERESNLILYDIYRKKAECWSYENEYRIFVDGQILPDHIIKNVKITGIYLGPSISQKNKEAVLKITKEKRINVHQMVLSQKEYKYKIG